MLHSQWLTWKHNDPIQHSKASVSLLAIVNAPLSTANITELFYLAPASEQYHVYFTRIKSHSHNAIFQLFQQFNVVHLLFRLSTMERVKL